MYKSTYKAHKNRYEQLDFEMNCALAPQIVRFLGRYGPQDAKA